MAQDKNRTFNIQSVVNTKIEQENNSIKNSRTQIVILDEVREPYYSAIRNVDVKLYEIVEEVNSTIVAVSNAYQERINVGCRTDMFWTLIDFNYDNNNSPPEEFTFRCEKINYISYDIPGEPGFGTARLAVSAGIGTTSGSLIPPTYGYETDNLHGLKSYNEPYMEDLLSTYIGSGIGTIGIASNQLYILAPINSGAITGLEVGQIVQSSKQLVFTGNVNTIVAIGTTSKNLSTIPNSGITTNSSVINVLTLQNNSLLSASSPEQDGKFVTFTVLINPNNIPDDYAVSFTSSPYTPQTVKMIDSSNVGGGKSVEYVNNGYPNVSKQWNHFLLGLQDISDLRIGKVITEPEVGAGLEFYRVGFTSAPAVYVANVFDHYAIEGETIITNVGIDTLNSEVRNFSLPTCTTQDASLSSAITIRNNKEAQFSSGISTFNSMLGLSNSLKEDLSELSLRIWAYRMQIGKARENLYKYDSFSGLINSPENKQIINE